MHYTELDLYTPNVMHPAQRSGGVHSPSRLAIGWTHCGLGSQLTPEKQRITADLQDRKTSTAN